MKPDTISLQRRHLMIAGLAGVAAPAMVFSGPFSHSTDSVLAGAELGAGESAQKLVVSGRIVGSGETPLAGAVVEVWRPGSVQERISVSTDADGRFMFATSVSAGRTGQLAPVECRVSYAGHEGQFRQLRFAHGRSGSDGLVARVQPDEAGVWRGSFGVTLA